MMMMITVHLGLDDVKLVLGSTADDLHPLLSNLLDQCLKRIHTFKTPFGGTLVCDRMRLV